LINRLAEIVCFKGAIPMENELYNRYLDSGADSYVEFLESEINRLKNYEKLVHFVAMDYHELSHDKISWQRDDWKKRCRQLIQSEYPDCE